MEKSGSKRSAQENAARWSGFLYSCLHLSWSRLRTLLIVNGTVRLSNEIITGFDTFLKEKLVLRSRVRQSCRYFSKPFIVGDGGP